MDTAHHIFNLRPKTAYVVILNEHVVKLAPTWYPSGQAEVTLDLKPGDRVTFVAYEDTVIATDVPPKAVQSPVSELYPNPSDGKFITVRSAGGALLKRLSVYAVTGTLVWEMWVKDGELIDLELDSGVYTWSLDGETGKITVVK